MRNCEQFQVCSVFFIHPVERHGMVLFSKKNTRVCIINILFCSVYVLFNHSSYSKSFLLTRLFFLYFAKLWTYWFSTNKPQALLTTSVLQVFCTKTKILKQIELSFNNKCLTQRGAFEMYQWLLAVLYLSFKTPIFLLP